MEERNELIKELFELHKLLADKGEISIGYGFSENYERLEAKVKKLTIPSVVLQSEQLKPLPPNECDVCGALIDHRLKTCTGCGF